MSSFCYVYALREDTVDSFQSTVFPSSNNMYIPCSEQKSDLPLLNHMLFWGNLRGRVYMHICLFVIHVGITGEGVL